MEIGREHANQAKGYEQTKQQVEVLNIAVETVFTMAAGKLPEGSTDRVQLEDLGHIYKAYSDLTVYTHDTETGKRPNWEEVNEVAKIGAGIAGMVCAPVAIGAGIESLPGDARGATRIIIKSAMEDLSASLKSELSDAQAASSPKKSIARRDSSSNWTTP